MRHPIKTGLVALVALGSMMLAANADGLKAAKDVKIAVVVHGAASDAYWSVVKRGVDDAAALTGADVQYYAPQVFDSVEQARLIDAAIATKPDGIAVSIPDVDALKKPIQRALDAGIPVINLDSGEKQGEDIGVMIDGEIVAFRPVKVYSEDYAQIEYGVSGEELDRFAQRSNKELDADRRAGRLKPFTGKLSRG